MTFFSRHTPAAGKTFFFFPNAFSIFFRGGPFFVSNALVFFWAAEFFETVPEDSKVPPKSLGPPTIHGRPAGIPGLPLWDTGSQVPHETLAGAQILHGPVASMASPDFLETLTN